MSTYSLSIQHFGSRHFGSRPRNAAPYFRVKKEEKTYLLKLEDNNVSWIVQSCPILRRNESNAQFTNLNLYAYRFIEKNDFL
jgi:hypothetical protein